jgi:hypothetical protein
MDVKVAEWVAKKNRKVRKEKDEEREISRIVNFQRASKCMLMSCFT